MKTFRARKWLIINPEKVISLSLKDVARIGNENTRKIQILSSKKKKHVSITTQYFQGRK